MNILDNVFFDALRADEVEAAHEIEKAAFPPQEAADLHAFQTRQSLAPSLFIGAYISPRTLIGYADATLAAGTTLTAASMHSHDHAGSSVCIHGVAVVEPHRRKGIATALLKEYIRRLQHAHNNDPDAQPERVLLICHEDLIPLYTKAGLMLVGPSPVEHGLYPWFEMRVDLRVGSPKSSHQEPPQMQPAVPPDILAAFTNPNPHNRPTARPFSSFTSHALLSPSGENAFDILCPRPGCGSIILKAGVAKLQHAPSVQLEPPTHAPPASFTRLPLPPHEIDWWLITPSPMAFENIAFSRPVPSSDSNPSTSFPKLKLLACAECDLGALGWSEEGGSEFWLAVERVAYR
ncbi:acyl-CoA N-acyltransferase [Ramaria rubella]|nr:acyl-CoA N-acyltransferase [Ramaria rubella]